MKKTLEIVYYKINTIPICVLPITSWDLLYTCQTCHLVVIFVSCEMRQPKVPKFFIILNKAIKQAMTIMRIKQCRNAKRWLSLTIIRLKLLNSWNFTLNLWWHSSDSLSHTPTIFKEITMNYRNILSSTTLRGHYNDFFTAFRQHSNNVSSIFRRCSDGTPTSIDNIRWLFEIAFQWLSMLNAYQLHFYDSFRWKLGHCLYEQSGNNRSRNATA